MSILFLEVKYSLYLECCTHITQLDFFFFFDLSFEHPCGRKVFRDLSYFFMIQPRSAGWEKAWELQEDAEKQRIILKGEAQHLFQPAGWNSSMKTLRLVEQGTSGGREESGLVCVGLLVVGSSQAVKTQYSHLSDHLLYLIPQQPLWAARRTLPRRGATPTSGRGVKMLPMFRPANLNVRVYKEKALASDSKAIGLCSQICTLITSSILA